MNVGTGRLFAIWVLIPKIVIKLQNALVRSRVPSFAHESALHQFFVHCPLLRLGRLHLALAKRGMSHTCLEEFIRYDLSVDVVFVHV